MSGQQRSGKNKKKSRNARGVLKRFSSRNKLDLSKVNKEEVDGFGLPISGERNKTGSLDTSATEIPQLTPKTKRKLGRRSSKRNLLKKSQSLSAISTHPRKSKQQEFGDDRTDDETKPLLDKRTQEVTKRTKKQKQKQTSKKTQDFVRYAQTQFNPQYAAYHPEETNTRKFSGTTDPGVQLHTRLMKSGYKSQRLIPHFKRAAISLLVIGFVAVVAGILLALTIGHVPAFAPLLPVIAKTAQHAMACLIATCMLLPVGFLLFVGGIFSAHRWRVHTRHYKHYVDTSKPIDRDNVPLLDKKGKNAAAKKIPEPEAPKTKATRW